MEERGKIGLFAKLKAALGRTKDSFIDKIRDLCIKKRLSPELKMELMHTLLGTDLGPKLSAELVANLDLNNVEPEALLAQFKQSLAQKLKLISHPLVLTEAKPYVICVVGINGAGKTTSIGKLAHFFKSQGKRVMLAAGDTFRAAAIEQLEAWANKNDLALVKHKEGADSAAVIFDALQSAKAKNIDILLADTAGRLHNKTHLMAELKKIVNVLKKIDPSAPHEILLVLDANIGQNAKAQAQEFHNALGVTGICLSKLDGSAKGAVIFSIVDELKIPIRFIGLGEGVEDLREFDPEAFVDALFET